MPTIVKHVPFWVKALQLCGLSPQKSLLVLTDQLALVAAALAVLLARAAFGDVSPELYHWILPLLLLGPPLGLGLGLYQTVSLPPHREFKGLFQMASLLYAIILTALFLAKTGDLYSRAIIGGGWVLSLVTLPVLRSLCRRRFSRYPWWGRPLVIFDQGDAGRDCWHYLKRHPERGLNPSDILPLPEDREATRALMAEAARKHPGAIALLVLRAGQERRVDDVTEASRFFDRILLVPAFGGGFRVHWLTPRDLGNAVGLLVRQNLRNQRHLRFKRAMDLLFCALGAVVLVPLGLGLALAIRLDSPGPVFYRQRRIGRQGREIRVFKFRTMVHHADQVLQDLLARDPQLQAEWLRDQKLRNDPRVTRVGRLLRKWSLDELPQLINVFLGHMSLVGPRPIVPGERGKYGPIFEEYCMVRPGITGLWQVSGRNNTTYAERVAYDHYYVNNWSVWMDVWILARTVPVVVTGYGAY